jgi:hypothetical protein
MTAERPDILFSIITPSAGRRPRALALAGASVTAAAEHARVRAGLDPARVEWLVGFDGVAGERPACGLANVGVYVIPRPEGEPGGFGNHVRNALMRAARGRRLLLLDDDNALTENALASFLPHLDAELVIGRIDTSRAFPETPSLPRPAPAGADPVADAVRQGNIDPLCLCLARELAFVRCRGWESRGGYESDFLNIRRYHRRAKSARRIEDLVGVYDAGRGLDPDGLNPRQRRIAPR